MKPYRKPPVVPSTARNVMTAGVLSLVSLLASPASSESHPGHQEIAFGHKQALESLQDVIAHMRSGKIRNPHDGTDMEESLSNVHPGFGVPEINVHLTWPTDASFAFDKIRQELAKMTGFDGSDESLAEIMVRTTINGSSAEFVWISGWGAAFRAHSSPPSSGRPA